MSVAATIFFVLFVLVCLAGPAWYFLPQLIDGMKLKRQNARVVNLTKQTKRDMDNLARRQRSRDGW